jgi:cob(I)alamin adenosyltransferase
LLTKGYTHLYTGNGKGKTTAALGLAFRAAGAGLKTIVIQFMKGQEYSELESAKKIDGLITIEQYGSRDFCMPDDKDIDKHINIAKGGYKRAMEVLSGVEYSVVILDEIVTAYLFTLISLDEILELIKNKKSETELVLTGRGATEKLIESCDLVTEMKDIKHYYSRGVKARKGIEN